MKSKIKILIAAIALFFFKAPAQQISTGIAAEISRGSVNITNIPSAFADNIKGNKLTGFEAGFFAKFSVNPLYIKPMALFSYRHGSVDVYKNETVLQNQSYSVSRILIPVLVGLKVIGPLDIEGGPVYNYVIASTTQFNGNEIGVAGNGVGYRIGAAADLGRLNLNVSYQGIKNSSSGGLSSYSSPDELIFGIGIGIGKK